MKALLSFFSLFFIHAVTAQTLFIKIDDKETMVTDKAVIKVTAKPSKISFKISPQKQEKYNVVSGTEIGSFDFDADNAFHETAVTLTFTGAEKKTSEIQVKNKTTNTDLLKFQLQLAPEELKFTISVGENATTQTIGNNGSITVSENFSTFKITNASGKKFSLSSNMKEIDMVNFDGDNAPHTINSQNLNYNEKGQAVIQIKEQGTDLIIFTFLFINTSAVKTKNNSNKNKPANVLQSLNTLVDDLGFDIDATQYGLVVKSGPTNYLGKQYVHIFLDQYGNTLDGTIPQGIADRQYVVHVFYLTGSASDLHIFDVKKTKGRFNPSLNFLNSNIRDTISSAVSGNISNYSMVHKEFLLGTSTSDIEFELTNTTIASADEPYIFTKEKVATYAIDMTPVYHGSFNVGFVNSRLENPTYELLENPANASEKVVKQTETGNRGVMTLMATIYTSPVVLVERLINKNNVAWNKTYSRNFLDDHKLFERFYPVLGVGFTDKTLENIFYGINWEVVRGAGLFLGWHWGKVNTFRTDGGFEFEKTPTTQAEFDLRKNREWHTEFSIGVNVDPFIVTRLLSGGLK